MSALLETNELTVSYGGLHANSNVNINKLMQDLFNNNITLIGKKKANSTVNPTAYETINKGRNFQKPNIKFSKKYGYRYI